MDSRRGLVVIAIGIALPIALLARPALAEPDDDDSKPHAIDPGVAAGPLLAYATRPPTGAARVCATRAPVCVHTSDRDGRAALAASTAFERAWQLLGGALGLPSPDLDPTTLAYDVFLVEEASIHGGVDLYATELEARDVRSRIDRARAFTVVDRRVRAGCSLDALAVAALARASLFRIAPATEEGVARAQTTYLADLTTPCSIALSADSALAFQTRRDLAFADAHAGDEGAAVERASPPTRSTSLFMEGAATFWARLDWAFGRTPGAIVPATWALHPTMTPLGAARWVNEPDTFDVLRTTFKGALTTKSTVDDLWLDFAIARAFLGSADDGFHLPELRTLGASATIPLDWDIPWPRAPRRLGPRTPIQPTGSSYLVIRRDGAPAGSRLRVEIEWEEHALFRWAFVKLAANGRELGRVVIPTTERATQAQMTLVDLDDVDRVLLVGVNAGDPSYAFDPDDEVWEPHGWLVTVAQE